MKKIKVIKFGKCKKTDEEMLREGQKLACKGVDSAVMAIYGLVKAGIWEEKKAMDFLEETVNYYAEKYEKMGDMEYLDRVSERYDI